MHVEWCMYRVLNSDLVFQWDFQKILVELRELLSLGLLLLTHIHALKSPSVIAIGHTNTCIWVTAKNPNLIKIQIFNIISFSSGQGKEKIIANRFVLYCDYRSWLYVYSCQHIYCLDNILSKIVVCAVNERNS